MYVDLEFYRILFIILIRLCIHYAGRYPKNHNIDIPRSKNHDIEIPRPKNCDIEIRGLNTTTSRNGDK